MKHLSIAFEAQSDLDEIWAFIARDNVAAAERWTDRLLHEFGLLANNPGLGHARKDLVRSPFLFWPVGSYLIVYKIDEEHIRIIAVTQGSRNLPDLFKQSGYF